jgi:magnesium chelatase family protein
MSTREPQRLRFRRTSNTICANAEMTTRQIRTHCQLGADSEQLLERAMQQHGLTARSHNCILKDASTIARLEGREHLTEPQLAKCIQYRTLHSN